jgi:hypothetical protein
MSYTIYKNVKVLQIKQERVSRRTRPQEIADPAKRRGDYTVQVAEIADLPATVSIADFSGDIRAGQYVSVAVNDKWQVIALVNHTTGTQAALKYKSMGFTEIGSILFFIAIPAVLFYSISKKAFETEKYHDWGWAIAGLGVLIILFILRGVGGQFSESKSALKELLG